METNLAEIPTENLIKEMSDQWRRLLDLVSLLDNHKTNAAIEHIRAIRAMQRELRLQDTVRLMQQAEAGLQFKSHAERLEAFLLRLLAICAEQGVSNAKPLAESLTEYLEAWTSREAPEETALRARLDQKVTDKQQTFRMS